MTFTITFSWWTIPVVLSALSVIGLAIYSTFFERDSWLSGIGTLFFSIPVLFFNTIVWIIAAFMK